MKILINNALALNKLCELQIIYPLFSLDATFCAGAELLLNLAPETAEVYSDLLSHQHLFELDYTEEEIPAIYHLQKQFPSLSYFESTSLYLAKREEAVLFATQRIVREAAADMGIAVCGYDWVFDQLDAEQIFPPMELFTRWQGLEKLFYSSTDATRPLCVQWFYEGHSLEHRKGRPHKPPGKPDT